VKRVSLYVLLAVLCVPMLGSDCDSKPKTDHKQRAATEKMVSEAHREVGMPGISNFTERKFARQILELRDTNLATFTYIVDLHGKLHFVCNSIGYGLPYSVQFTNPERLAGQYESSQVTLPQPDPNGLFMPDGLSATWILCDNGEGGVSPVYSEPALLVSPFPLKASGESYDKGR